MSFFQQHFPADGNRPHDYPPRWQGRVDSTSLLPRTPAQPAGASLAGWADFSVAAAQPAASLPQPERLLLAEGPAELAQESPRRHRAWQLGLASVLIIAVGYAVTNFGYFMARTFTFGYSYQAGQEWTYNGITFRVEGREVLENLPGEQGITTKAQPGAVFVKYHVKVSGYHYDAESRKASSCEFSLQGTGGQQWNLYFGSAQEQKVCDYKNPLAEQEIFPVFQVPKVAVPELQGLKLRLQDPRPVPLLQEPK